MEMRKAEAGSLRNYWQERRLDDKMYLHIIMLPDRRETIEHEEMRQSGDMEQEGSMRAAGRRIFGGDSHCSLNNRSSPWKTMTKQQS